MRRLYQYYTAKMIPNGERTRYLLFLEDIVLGTKMITRDHMQELPSWGQALLTEKHPPRKNPALPRIILNYKFCLHFV
jgi:hypothetical protein